MSADVHFLEFPDRLSASAAAAGLIAKCLREALDRSGQTSLVVSGGTTPRDCFANLSRLPLDWSRVTIVPSDERWVEPHCDSSNEHLIHTRLMLGPASAARLLSFYRPELDVAEAPEVLEAELEQLPRPFACSLLGMGEDGHFASLFPDFDGLADALNPVSARQCLMVKTAGSPYLRISLSLSALLNTSLIVLLIFGEGKRRVFEAAVQRGTAYPAEALLSQQQVPVRAIWAP